MNVLQTERFSSWFARLKDKKARARIQMRIDRLEDGNFGDHHFVGDKASQSKDIKIARLLAKQL